jgi:hypothetical protein
LNGVGTAQQQVNNLKNSGTKFNNGADDIYTQLMGVANYALMTKLQAHTLADKLPSIGRENLIANASLDAFKSLMDKNVPLTAENIAKAAMEKSANISQQILNKGASALKRYAFTAADLTGFNMADALNKKLTNTVSGNEVFHNVGDELENNLKKVLTTDAPMFAIGGEALNSTGALFSKSPLQNDVVDALHNDSSPEAVDRLKQQIAQHGQQVGWSDNDIQQSVNHIGTLADAVHKLPTGLDESKRVQATDLIIGRNELEQQAAKVKEYRDNLDHSINDVPTAHEQLLQDKIDQANDKIRGLIMGKPVTYRKGTGEDEGKFYKRVDGKDVEISESRHSLEDGERNARAEANRESARVQQTQIVQIPATQDNVADSEANEAKQTTFTNVDISNADPNEPQDAKIKAVQDNFTDGDRVEFKVDGKVVKGHIKDGRIQDEQGNHWGWLAILTGKDNYIKKLDSEQGIENNPIEGSVQENEAPAGNAPQEQNPKWSEDNHKEWEDHRINLAKSIFEEPIDENTSVGENIQNVKTKLNSEFQKIKSIIGDDELANQYISAIQRSPKRAEKIRNNLPEEQRGLLFNRINEEDFEDNHEYASMRELGDIKDISDNLLFGKLGNLLVSPKDMEHVINRVIAKNLFAEAIERGYDQKEIVNKAVENLKGRGHNIDDITQLLHKVLSDFGEKKESSSLMLSDSQKSLDVAESDEVPAVQVPVSNGEEAQAEPIVNRTP